MNATRLVSLAFVLTALTPLTHAQDASSTTNKIAEALALDYRTTADRARDANRQPASALAFMGLQDDMNVFEFGPGDGWYTKILMPVLADKGSLAVGVPGKRYPPAWTATLRTLLDTRPMRDVKQVEIDLKWLNEEMAWDLGALDFQANNLDMFLMIREYHNLQSKDRARVNKAVFESLRPGGRYVVIDHTRRHMQAESPENWRREDPVQVLVEIQSAGFELIKHSDMFYRADDTLEYEVARRSVAGNTDRFFFVFEKPMD